jgi:hypothetical protein
MPTLRTDTDETETPAEVARAAAAVRRAIGGLIRLLGDEDPAVVRGAAAALAALAALGAPAVVGPLAAALPRAPTPRHRALIVAALTPLGREFEGEVLRALIGALKREADPFVVLEVRRALTTLIGYRVFPPGPPARSMPAPVAADARPRPPPVEPPGPEGRGPGRAVATRRRAATPDRPRSPVIPSRPRSPEEQDLMDATIDGFGGFASTTPAACSCTDLLPGCPSRPLDWRWQRAVRLARGEDRRRPWDDDWVARARRFLASPGRAGGASGRDRRAGTDPAVSGARGLRGGPPRRRWELEARLLAGQSDSEIAGKMNIEARVVGAYEAVFYDVRDGLGASDWIHLVVIGHRLHEGFDPGDAEVILKAYAYNFGPVVLGALLESVFTDGEPPADPRLADRFRLAFAVQAIEVTAGNAADVLRLYQLSLELAQREVDSAAGPVNRPIVVGALDVPVPAEAGYRGAPGQDVTEPPGHEEGRADRQLRPAG